MSVYDCIDNSIKCFMRCEIEKYHFKHNPIIARNYEKYIMTTNIIVPYGKRAIKTYCRKEILYEKIYFGYSFFYALL